MVEMGKGQYIREGADGVHCFAVPVRVPVAGEEGLTQGVQAIGRAPGVIL